MITRASDDFSVFNNQQLEKIAATVERTNNKKLYDTYPDRERALIAKQELRVQGFQAEVNEVTGGSWEVYAIIPAKVNFQEANNSGAFKRLAFGRYIFEKSSSLEMHSYPFDEGSIWVMATDEDGNQILVKEVDDHDGENVIRKKQDKNTTKVAASNERVSFTDDHPDYTAIINVLFNDTSDMIDALLDNEGTKNVVNKFFNDTMLEYIERHAKEHGIADPAQLHKLDMLVKDSLGTQIKDLTTLDKFVKEYAASEIEKTEDGQNIFE